MNLEEVLKNITPVDQKAMTQAQNRWDAIAKPLGGLGLLEQQVVRISGMIGTSQLAPFEKTAVVVMCADNGVVAENVTQTGQEVTAMVSENMSKGETSVCRMAEMANMRVIPVDIGVATPLSGKHILQKNIRRGTGNISKESAMTKKEAEEAILVGIEIVGDLKQQGFQLIATGEMGIGNTTTSTAVTSVLLGKSPEEITGTGAGLSSDGLKRKISAIKRAIEVNQPNKSDPLEVLHKIGGLDMAGLVGVFLGGALHGIPILIDGVISMTSALVAQRLCPIATDYMIATHGSAEPSGLCLMEELGKFDLVPILFAEMRLGEGTGAVAAFPMLQMALAVYCEMSTFEDIKIDAYKELK